MFLTIFSGMYLIFLFFSCIFFLRFGTPDVLVRIAAGAFFHPPPTTGGDHDARRQFARPSLILFDGDGVEDARRGNALTMCVLDNFF